MRQVIPRTAEDRALLLFRPVGNALAPPWTPGAARLTSRADHPGFLPPGRLGRLARVGRLNGLGTGETEQLAVSAGSVAATGGLAIGSAIAAGASLTIPIVGAAIAGVALAVQAILHSGCGQTCVITSNWANQAEELLKKNVAAYLAVPSPRPRAAQVAALANFDAVWNYLRQECGSPQVGDAGKACIADRQAGACKWKDAGGQCWNWFIGYRDPIADDPTVVDTQASAQAEAVMGADPVGHLAAAVSEGVDNLGANFGMSTGTLLLLAGVVLLALGAEGK